jgi:hypothetical protein
MFEERGIPSVYFALEYFRPNVDKAVEMNGMPALRRVVQPAPAAGREWNYAEIMPKLLDNLTRPLTNEENKTGKIVLKGPERVAVTGSLGQVNSFFMENRWSDGLPIIPPTEEVVKEFLKHTSHPPGEVVTTTMWPEEWKVTVEKVAIVGVMAGCKPEYMPVLLAMIETFGDRAFSSAVRSTNAMAYPTMVNGPIRDEIGMNSGINALGPGNQANATIGRFLRLAIINLGGSWPGVNDMSVQGNVAKYGFAFAENEEESPWEPFHVSHGRKKDSSTVTMWNGAWSHVGNSSDLDVIARSIVQFQSRNGCLILLGKNAAKSLAEKGMSKQGVEQYVWERATTTMKEFKANAFSFVKGVWEGVPQYGELDLWEDYRGLPDDAVVRAYPRKYVNVAVVGEGGGQAWKAAWFRIGNVDKWR